MSEVQLGWAPTGEFVVKRTDHWVVVVTPMLFNNRICIATPEEFGRFYTAGWCYSRTEHPMFDVITRAMEWDPETERTPDGFLKEAYDRREGSLL